VSRLRSLGPRVVPRPCHSRVNYHGRTKPDAVRSLKDAGMRTAGQTIRLSDRADRPATKRMRACCSATSLSVVGSGFAAAAAGPQGPHASLQRASREISDHRGAKMRAGVVLGAPRGSVPRGARSGASILVEYGTGWGGGIVGNCQPRIALSPGCRPLCAGFDPVEKKKGSALKSLHRPADQRSYRRWMRNANRQTGVSAGSRPGRAADHPRPPAASKFYPTAAIAPDGQSRTKRAVMYTAVAGSSQLSQTARAAAGDTELKARGTATVYGRETSAGRRFTSPPDNGWREIKTRANSLFDARTSLPKRVPGATAAQQ